MKGRHLLWQFLIVIPILFAFDSGNAGEVPTYAYHTYEKYKTVPHFRAFVITSIWKRYGVATYYYRSPSIDEAIAKALGNCQQIAMDGANAATSFDCKLHSIGNIFVHGMNDEELDIAIELYKAKRSATNKDLAGFIPGESSVALADVEATEPKRKIVALGLTLPQLIERAEHSTFAQFELGKAFEDGRAPPKDLGFAQKWYMKAATGGHKVAQYKIGWMYEEGLGGLQKDRERALHWYRKSSSQDYHAAINALSRLATAAY